MMENNLENRLSMYQKVQFYLNNHASETASIPVIATLEADLEDKVNSVLALASIADTDITGYTVDKQLKRNDLTIKIPKLSSAIVAHASMNSDKILVEKCDETFNSMGHMRDNDLYTFGQLIINEATPIITSLVPYGVVAGDLTAANDASVIYLDAIQSPRGQINERNKALTDLVTAMKSTDELVKDKLDKVMGVFQATNTSLYNGYLGARSIDGTGSQTPEDYSGKVGAGQMATVATLPYLPSRSFEIENTGTVVLTFGLSTSTTEINGAPVLVAPGAMLVRKSTTLNTSEAAEYLLLQNADPNITGSYKIWVME